MAGTAVNIHIVAGARPNFMKVAPLWRELSRCSWAKPSLIHTGQHYGEMSDVFMKQFGLPDPNHMLHAGSGTHAEQTAGVMVAYERVCLADRPDWVIVVGDVNSTLAAALVAKKLVIPLAHLEAGLRSFDRSMPEEINRIVTDSISDLLWTPSPDADTNLTREGVSADRIERVGNIMIDSFEMLRSDIEGAAWPQSKGLSPHKYGVVTLHRPSNVDCADRLSLFVKSLLNVSRQIPIVFPVHPRTRQRLEAFGLMEALVSVERIHLEAPLGYVEFMSAVSSASFVLTDSGGVQEETTYLGIPCLTLRDSTERPITVLEGSNRLTRIEALCEDIERVLSCESRSVRRPELWDGRTASRVAASLQRHAFTGR